MIEMQAKLSSLYHIFSHQSTLRFFATIFRHIQVIDYNRIIGARMSGLERIPTHIEGLDENMQGGIPQGHICLVAGASGAMKSSLTFHAIQCSVIRRN